MAMRRTYRSHSITAIVGHADAAVIYRNPTTTKGVIPVGIQVYLCYELKDYCYTLVDQIEEANTTFNHENLVNVDRSKWSWDDAWWIVMPPLPGKSLRCAITSCFRHGLPENSVAFVLKETLKALDYIHRIKNGVHLNVGADCIFVDRHGNVKLALRSLSYCPCDYVRRLHLGLQNSGKSRNPRRERRRPPPCLDVAPSKCGAGGYPGWAAAPESTVDRGKATDVWMFGLLAVELFYGWIPDLQKLLFPLLNKENDSRFKFEVLVSCFKRKKKEMPEQLVEVVAACLSGDPKKRPTTNQLMEYKFFEIFPGNHSILAEACKIDIPICWVPKH